MKHVFSQLPQETALALKLLHGAGHEAVLVGGCVRDACMGIPPHDWDIATSALPQETARVFSAWPLQRSGEKHGTVTVLFSGGPVGLETLAASIGEDAGTLEDVYEPYLLMNGHRKLGILVSEPEVTVIRQRLDGFLKCARACGVEVEVLHPHIEIGESSPLRSYEFFKQYLSEHPKPGFTGLFVVSMFPAREVIRAANECGLEIPRDFSLISLGRAGHKAGEDITRINTRRDLVVSYAVRLVKDYFEHKENTPMFHIVPTEIHQGNTVRNIGFPQ